MKTRTVVVGVLWLAGAAAAGEKPTTTPAGGEAARVVESPEETAKALGVTLAELKQLRAFGYSDSEILHQLTDNKRTARQLITERGVIDTFSKALAEVDARVYQMSASKRNSEREAATRAALAKVRREHRTSRDELRKILAG